ncbi:hypothetical protein [Paraeggerthella hongkongensis]|uniref:Uncharacterized protein n=1 Tax=Paraeggerthella hongkongensis TaxID=230658 RepID=A0A3N0BF18_9ACTN|nr:hypothetical protein [Paraeggerthella hongkongensis]RNL45773.1 hypothetical protein DMP08_05500 [Paraeggerthella hongkongensis]
MAGLPFSTGSESTDVVVKADASTYRELVCEPGSTCCIGLKVENLAIGSLPLQGIAPGNPIAKRNDYRPPFDDFIVKALQVNPCPVRCHSVSLINGIKVDLP